MNRYPMWKYLLIAVTLIAALLYALPNLYGESPAVQISAAKSTTKVDAATRKTALDTLAAANIPTDGVFPDATSLKVRFKDTDAQIKAKDLIQTALGENYIVALNLLPQTPSWLAAIGGKPMFLGLDLRGGVHFLLEVDMKAAVDKQLEKVAGDIRRELKDRKIRYGRVARDRDSVTVQLRDAATVSATAGAIRRVLPDLSIQEVSRDGDYRVVVSFTPAMQTKLKNDAVAQNITTLHNRVNELGVAEPIIQQQGEGRIVVQLPGVQDTAKAKDILGRTATLEVRMVDDDQARLQAALSGDVPAGYELVPMAGVRAGMTQSILLKKEVELTGDNITKAEPSYDQNNNPVISMGLDSAGASIFRTLTAENIGKGMAIVLVEKGKGQVITAPRINAQLGGSFVIEGGGMTVQEANDIALLVRAGSLAAPMNIVEERTIGPSLGKENIQKGFHSTMYGFIAIAIFMMLYYRLFGVVSTLALGANLLFLVALLSAIGITLTLPGIAAIALALGMAIDSNVLVNERIREELRNGMSPQAAIQNGYGHAWATILDSNITTLIAGIALFIFGSGAVRGFAVVHCLGILTSMYSAVFVSRGIVNLIYGYRRRLSSVSIGQVWVPHQEKQA
ncbi:preprotein translocase subunit SecD [Chitiniphilus shinanonensis]|uniref:Protein translocase subunit SecD n=1 Tax=Chitiniphilus shinanonensis TaxID=553088 RepID=A0ABQ6BXJ3_9NEIS|nr:protein translocase subunit SecD [Chitiniphilus shinanonensis]GLS04509.1 preprotein translocase subunit SecD [Chitiniphilus shinanonensis]